MISAKVICDSISSVDGKRITTFELEYPRIIHSELMTHRMFSRNASSSRAVPVSKVIDMVRTNPAMPVRFGANQSGMQDSGSNYNKLISVAVGYGYNAKLSSEGVWKLAANRAADFAEAFSNAGYHKQVCNRLTEPFQWMKTLVTATEYDNFFWLRRDEDADPTIKALADCMWEALQESTPFKLFPGEWHVPYVKTFRDFDGNVVYAIETTEEWDDNCFVDIDTNTSYHKLTKEQALAISSSCCAQISYRKLDNSLEKAEDIYSKLVSGRKVHGSPFEHAASPMEERYEWDSAQPWVNERNTASPKTWEKGVTHVDKESNLWSNNFQGWIQYRALIPNNVCKDYKE